MKTWVKRAIRTFIQTAVGYISVSIVTVDFSADKSAIKTALMGIAISAASAGMAAVMNFKESEGEK